MQAAALDPDGVRRLVLANAVGIRGDWLPHMHDSGVAHLERTGHAQAAARLAAHDPAVLQTPDLAQHATYTAAYFPAWFADPSFAARAVPPVGRSVTGAHVSARLRREGYDWSDRIGALRCPTLVLHGVADVLPLAVADTHHPCARRAGRGGTTGAACRGRPQPVLGGGRPVLRGRRAVPRRDHTVPHALRPTS